MNDTPRRQAQLHAIVPELNNLVEQSPKKIARDFFRALVRTMGVRSGRVFLTDAEGNPEYCLVLKDGQRVEYDESTSPSLYEQALAGWTYRRGRSVLITDADTDPRWASWALAPEESLAGSAIAVPMLIAAQSTGAIALIAEDANHFCESDLTTINTLANQAASIIETARLKTLSTQQQSTIDALSKITHTISTSQDLPGILGTILRQLVKAVPLQHGMMLLREDQNLRPVAVAGLADDSTLSRRVFTPADIPSVSRILSQGSTVVANDEEQLIDLSALAFPERTQWGVIAPVLADRETLGAVILASSRAGTLDSQSTLTIDIFVNHAAIAIAKNRHVDKTDRRLKELAFLNETGQAITSTLNLDRILHLLLERVRELLQIDAASIALRDEKTGELVFEVASGEGAGGVLGVRLEPGQGIAGWVAETGKPLVVQDVYSDMRFYAEIDKRTGMKTQAILCVPIVLKGRVVGIIEALNPDKTPFDEQAIELLSALASQAATAIDNGQLFARVRRAEARYEGLFEDSVNPIIITDLKGTIVEVNRNACALLDQTKEALQGTDLTHLRSAEDTFDFLDPYRQIMEGKETVFQTNILSDGQRIAIEVSGKRIQLKEISLIQWIGRDISAEIELEKTREDMSRMLIHDLRNPLANIMNSLTVMHDVILEDDDSVSLSDVLNIARRSGRRMHQLISSILDIGRLETGQAVIETQPADLVPLLQEAVQFVKPQTDIRNIQITTSFAPNLPQVDIDSDMISRVALNLLDNAIKFSQMGGKIILTARTTESMVEVSVADNGPGIPANQLESIFGKFVRVQSKNGPQGTGLGLAFCKLAVENHGGQIWTESILGQGATFRFTLPVYSPDTAQ